MSKIDNEEDTTFYIAMYIVWKLINSLSTKLITLNLTSKFIFKISLSK